MIRELLRCCKYYASMLSFTRGSAAISRVLVVGYDFRAGAALVVGAAPLLFLLLVVVVVFRQRRRGGRDHPHLGHGQLGGRLPLAKLLGALQGQVLEVLPGDFPA